MRLARLPCLQLLMDITQKVSVTKNIPSVEEILQLLERMPAFTTKPGRKRGMVHEVG